MKVREIMTSDVVVAAPDTSVNTAAQLMGKGKISGIPVVDASGRVIGIVSELDLIVRNARFEGPAFFQILDGRIPLETPAHYRKRLRHMLGTEVRDVMTEEVVSVGPDEEVEALADLMVKKRVNPVPVIEEGRLVGIVSRADIIRMMARDLAD
jgi:CBS domain-containing protein